jgi:hypothetical protein
MPAAGYLLQAGPAIANWWFGVNPDGTIAFDSALDGFLTGRGQQRLTVQGVAVTIDTRDVLSDLAGHSGSNKRAPGALPVTS